MAFKKTKQQLDIELASDSGDNIKISAYAGCSKTTILSMIGDRHPEKLGLYVAFNKSAQVDAERRMPPNITSRTFHSLGWAAMDVSRVYGNNGVGNMIRMSYSALRRYLRLPDERTLSIVKKTVQRYIQSLDETITRHHVPREALISLANENEKRQFADDITRAARLLWKNMSDHGNRNFQLPHDGYLKLWYHNGGELPFYPDMVMIDEAQDMNPINWGLVQKWSGQRFVVGDSYQQIYSFRGAIDAMKRVDYRTMMLSKSFRFGEAIADVANNFLMLDGDIGTPLVGNNQVNSKVVFDNNRPDGKYTILCRTNMGLMDEAIQLAKQGKSIAIVGDIQDSLRRLTSAWSLFTEDYDNVKHPDIQMFADWDGLLEASGDDHELGMTVKRVEEYGGRVPEIAESLRIATGTNEDKADVIISTAHKAKGREWPVVVLAEDFPDLIRVDKQGNAKILKDERNLAYVSATRAINVLYGNSMLLKTKSYMTHRANTATSTIAA